MTTPEARPPGLAERLGGVVDTLLGTLQTRLSLLAVEVEEEGVRLAGALFNLILAAFFIGFFTLTFALFITVWLWDTHRLLALGVDAAMFLALSLLTARNAYRRLSGGTHLFRHSVGEIARDREAIGGQPPE
ncbi:phage holin family protein [Niveibacterium sp. SC-1]|uniref:phage holin family protein n=1 Tax=Niveibacterium sp. SC-1 TaxID=3135646 RepID=UPI00311F3FB1